MFYVGNILWLEGLESYPKNFSGCIRSVSGNIFWLMNGDFHRDPDPVTGEELPARIMVNGVIEYYQYGQKHRVNGPARIFPGHFEEWWLQGTRIKCFRTDR